MEDQKMIVLCRFYYESQRCGILFIGYDAVTLIIEGREYPPIDFTHRPSGTHTSHGKAMGNQSYVCAHRYPPDYL